MGVLQLVDLNSTMKCNTTFPTQYPVRVRQTAGGLLEDTPIICGGYNPDTKRRVRECYALNYTTNSWEFLANMTVARQDHATVLVGDSLWMTGGEISTKVKSLSSLSSTEYIYRNGTVIRGPYLPSGIVWSGHCLVNLLDGRVMFLGIVPNRRGVLFYHTNTKKFSEGPSLLYPRLFHACALFESPRRGGRPVVISIGGYSGRTVEVYDYTRKGSTWEESKWFLKLNRSSNQPYLLMHCDILKIRLFHVQMTFDLLIHSKKNFRVI